MIASNVDLEDLARNTSHHVFGLGLHERKVIIDDGEPVAVIMSAGEFERLEAERQDALDLTLALTRMLTDSGKRISLRDVLAEFGIDPSEL